MVYLIYFSGFKVATLNIQIVTIKNIFVVIKYEHGNKHDRPINEKTCQIVM
jgi:hypothetical protein